MDSSIRHVDWWKNVHHATSLRYSNEYESHHVEEDSHSYHHDDDFEELYRRDNGRRNYAPPRFHSFIIGSCLREEDWW